MQVFNALVFLLFCYLLGSIPFGLVLVRLKTGQDIRVIQSGRTGGTNAMRAAGFWVGLGTAILDCLKAASTVWLASTIFPGNEWIKIIAPIAAIIGHNYSIYLVNRDESGRLRLRGGAGGAACLGGSVGLWWPSLFIIVPIGAFSLFVIGYASVATMSIAFTSMIIFAVLAVVKNTPWIYVLYGFLAEIILVWALRPNIERLMNGTERIVGLRAKKASNEVKS